MRKGDIRAEKNALRAEFRMRRNEVSQEHKQDWDRKILNNLLSLREYANCQSIFTYVNLEKEIDTRALILRALADGKQVYAPRCIEGAPLMQFYRICAWQDLKIGSFGILEPDLRVCPPAADFSEGICILPGFCFDKDGYRLGYGKGYYDRFLSQFGGITIGLCYTMLLVEKLPRGYFDRAADIVVTEEYIRRGEKLQNRKQGGAERART